jgi:hypothetical protein
MINTINNEQLNTDNLAVRTRTVHRHIWHKTEFFCSKSWIYFILPNVILPVSPPSIFLIWFRTRFIRNNMLYNDGYIVLVQRKEFCITEYVNCETRTGRYISLLSFSQFCIIEYVNCETRTGRYISLLSFSQFCIIEYVKCETRTGRYISLLSFSTHFKSTITLIPAFIGSARVMFRHVQHRIYMRSAIAFKKWNN